MALPLLIKALALTQVVVARMGILSPERVDPSAERVDLSAVSVEQVDSAVRISVSKTYSVHSGELNEAGVHANNLSRKRHWSEKTSKSRRT